MLKRLLTLVGVDNEILKSSLVDVADSSMVKLNTGMDEAALEKLYLSNKPGTEIPLSKLPYTTTEFLAVVNNVGQTLYFPKDIIVLDYDSKFPDVESNLAVLDENGEIVTHSKYVFDQKGNSGKGVLKANKLYVEPFVIVPDLGQ